MYITGQWEEFTVNNTTLYTFFAFIYSFIHKKNCVILTSIYFFDEVSNFHQNNIDQSEIGIGDKKLSVEPYAKIG